MSTTTTLLTLPFLALISIPLVITASITVFFSAIALFLQLSVISIELCYALITNLFAIPPSPNWSLLSLNVSGPPTPDRRRSSDYGFLQTPLVVRGQTQGRPSLGPRMGSSNPLLDSPDQDPSMPPYQLTEAKLPHITTVPTLGSSSPHHKRNTSGSGSGSGFQGLINGDENRDFEGLGGWRCPASYTKSPGYRSGGTSPSSPSSLGDEIDDMAWVSINRRLELPSRPLMLRHSSSNHNLAYAYSHNDTAAEPYLPRRKRSIAGLSAMTSDSKRGGSVHGHGHGHGKGRGRHHRRSATTSALSGSGLGFCTPPASATQGYRAKLALGLTAMQSRGDGLRSKSHGSLAEQWVQSPSQSRSRSRGQNAGSSASSVSSAGSGYFGLQPMTSE